MGVKNGAWCVGCCWALMASLFALGVMSVVWMAVVAGLIAVEKTLPWRRVATYGTAASCSSLGVLLLVAPDAIPALTIPGSGPMSPMGTDELPSESRPLGTVVRRMAASGEKPYRVYRGGRSKGHVPLERKSRREKDSVRRDGGGTGRQAQRGGGGAGAGAASSLVTVLVLVVLARRLGAHRAT